MLSLPPIFRFPQPGCWSPFFQTDWPILREKCWGDKGTGSVTWGEIQCRGNLLSVVRVAPLQPRTMGCGPDVSPAKTPHGSGGGTICRCVSQ